MFLRDNCGQRPRECDEPDLRGGDPGSLPCRQSALPLLLLLSVLLQASLASAADAPRAVYVTSELAGAVAVVAGEPPRVVREIVVGNRPHNLEATKGGLLVVATQGDNSLSVVDPGNDPPTVRRIRLGAPPHDVAVAEDGTTVYVLSERGLLAQVDPSSGQVLKTVELGGSPHDLIAAAGVVWITDISARRIIVVDAGFSVRALPISIVGHGLALRPGSPELWITPWAGNRTVIIDSGTGKEVADLRAGQDPSHKHIAFNEDGSEAWLSEPASGSIFVVDASTRRVAGRIGVGGHPHHVRFADGRAYVAVAPNDLVVLDARDRQLIGRLPAGSGVHDVELVDPPR
jgi:DNA-binding beta-propeller fold protein YncE